tara:strand:+ start:1878 stop:2183 length:306 start_codon:yes stop_codon:yes gene_type:complete
VTASYAKTSADFPNRAKQISHIANLARHLLEPIFVYNALKTARKVLGDGMPMNDEAQQWESRTAQVLKEAVEAADRLRTRDGVTTPHKYVGSLQDAVKRCQ